MGSVLKSSVLLTYVSGSPAENGVEGLLVGNSSDVRRGNGDVEQDVPCKGAVDSSDIYLVKMAFSPTT